MKINYRVKGADRKPLITAISRELNTPAQYKGAPTFEYEVGGYNIDKVGMLTGPDNRGLVIDLLELHGLKAVSEEYDSILADQGYLDIDQHYQAQYADPNIPVTEEMLRQAEAWMEGMPEGIQSSEVREPESRTYRAELSDPDYPDRMEIFDAKDDEDALRQAYEYVTDEIVLLELHELDDDFNILHAVDIVREAQTLVIEMPISGFTPEKLDNLGRLVNAKAPLLKAALGADELPIRHKGDTLEFPWFGSGLDAETTEAYAMLISKICAAAQTKSRITAKARDTDNNPKYAMRCWLLSLGFIGDEYKAARKILTSKLDGNASWRSGHAPTKTQSSETEVAADE